MSVQVGFLRCRAEHPLRWQLGSRPCRQHRGHWLLFSPPELGSTSWSSIVWPRNTNPLAMFSSFISLFTQQTFTEHLPWPSTTVGTVGSQRNQWRSWSSWSYILAWECCMYLLLLNKLPPRCRVFKQQFLFPHNSGPSLTTLFHTVPPESFTYSIQLLALMAGKFQEVLLTCLEPGCSSICGLSPLG